ncbi:MAG: hypothetical protein HY895_14730 [Deltaproteobacteria bacterium]|nr:hypothetical protein [Deltaproteobacteria bacterium]
MPMKKGEPRQVVEYFSEGAPRRRRLPDAFFQIASSPDSGRSANPQQRRKEVLKWLIKC